MCKFTLCKSGMQRYTNIFGLSEHCEMSSVSTTTHAVRYNGMPKMKDIFSDGNKDTKHVTLKEPASFRWLSLQNAVDAVYKVLSALVMSLEQEALIASVKQRAYLNQWKVFSFC